MFAGMWTLRSLTGAQHGQKTLISAMSACILVFIWDGRHVPTRYPHTRSDTTRISLYIPLFPYFRPSVSTSSTRLALR